MKTISDITNQVFGRLRVIRSAGRNQSGQLQYECQCLCPLGKTLIVTRCNLLSGHTRSRGCMKIESDRNRLNDLTGRTFGRLTVLRRDSHNTTNGYPSWLCKCSCGNPTLVSIAGYNLLSGATKSCGCLHRELASERMKKWDSETEHQLSERLSLMKQRCYNPNCPGYPDWGGRGIYICDEWMQDSTKFVEWAKANGFRPELWIDRIDNDGPYSPENCRFTSASVQQNNKRSNVKFEIDGLIHNISEWANISGLNYHTLIGMYHRNPGEMMEAITSSDGFQSYLENT